MTSVLRGYRTKMSKLDDLMAELDGEVKEERQPPQG